VLRPVSRGVAIEARICAEDPDKRFFPSPGTITRVVFPVSEHVRVDSGVVDGSVVSPAYDSLLAKMIVWGETREAVMNYLQAKGLGDLDAGKLLDSLFGERAAEIRREGFKRMAMGCALMLCGLAGYYFHREGMLSHKAFSATLVVGAWGLLKVIGGFWKVQGARRQQGEISNLGD